MSPLRRALLGSLLLSGCVAPGDPTQAVSPIAIPGRWIAPPATQAVAATQHVPVVDPPAVSPLGRCTSTNAFACSCTHPACMPALPGTRELDAYLRRRFTFLRAGGTYCCRQNSATTSVPRHSVHSLGRAIDLMVPMDRGDADNTLGDQVANWLVENAEHIGIQRVVWDRSYWNGERGFGPLASNSLPHTDHLHVELSLDGAARRTPFFTSGAAAGTSCEPRCDGSRVIAANCAVTECATTGATCVGGPPRCGAPPAPEPAEAAPVPGAPRPTLRALTDALRVTPLAPSRRFDTRTPAESTRLVRSTSGALAENTVVHLRDWSDAGLPAGTRAVWMNLTALSDTLAGFVTAWPEGEPRPETSSLNYAARDIRANAAAIALSPAQGLSLMPSSAVHLVGDLSAAFAPTGGGLALVPPTRVYDSRSASNPLRSNEVRTITLPAPAGATGVFGTLAVVAGDAPGFAQVFPCGGAIPLASAVNFPGPGVASNAFASALRDNTLCVLSNTDVDAIVDITGYVTPTGTLAYRPVAPVRLLDTRGTATPYTGRLAARQVVELAVQSLPGAPANLGAVVANVVALGATEPGFLSVFPCGGAVPGTSSLNFPVETPRSTLTLSGLGGGRICVFSSARAHLVVDLMGVWVSTAGAAPEMPPATDPEDDGDDLHPDLDAGVARGDVPGAAPVDAAPAGDRGGTNDVPGGAVSPRPDVPGSPGDNNGDHLPAADAGADTDLDRPGCSCRATAATHRGAGLLVAWALASRRRRQSATARRRVSG
ncbi:MAG: hypothetical protein U0325_11575 [Polyangiales bacterium]